MLTEEQMRDALRQCPHDTVENLRVRWLYAKDFARAIESAATAPLLARIAEQDALIGNLRLEAQIQAQEARTANASIAEIYQAVTGGTGEPGNWHGAAPVKARIAELTRELEEARKDAERRLDLVERVRKYPENIDHKGSLLWGDILREVDRAAIKEQT